MISSADVNVDSPRSVIDRNIMSGMRQRAELVIANGHIHDRLEAAPQGRRHAHPIGSGLHNQSPR